MTYKKKLIEVALPLGVISEESAKQKTMGAAPHYQNIHRWWARRPSAAARAMLWASLVDDPSSRPNEFPTEELQDRERKRLFSLLERITPWEAQFDEALMQQARVEILKSADGDSPRILDPFGGGGAIPIEGLRLGLPTYSGDLNPVAVILQKAMMELPATFAHRAPVAPGIAETRTEWVGLEGLIEDVRHYGEWMEKEAHRRIGDSYTDSTEDQGSSARVVGWIWARTVKSPDPSWNGSVPLVRSWKLVSKPGRSSIWIQPKIDAASQEVTYEVVTGGNAPDGNVGRNGGRCIATGTPIPFSYIREQGQQGRLGQALLAVIYEDEAGRHYRSPNARDQRLIPPSDVEFLNRELDGKAAVNVGNYGISKWSDLFTQRQLLSLTTFSDLLPEVIKKVVKESKSSSDDSRHLRDGGFGTLAYGEAVATYLALAIDKCTDFWSTICTWNSPNSQVRYTFSKQAIPMTWDYVEVNPFSKKMGSWSAMLQGVVKGISVLPFDGSANVKQRDATARIEEVGRCVISTDPPYYDNISYADLSDFFYVWLRHNLKTIWPDECATLLTPKTEELIADAKRAGSRAAAQKHFELGMEGVFAQAALNADERYPATVFYAFKATESMSAGGTSTGWESFLSGLMEAGFTVTATWPVRTEFAAKIGIAAGDNMLASSIVLACRKRDKSASFATRGEFINSLKEELEPAVRLLQRENIAPVDLAQSSIGPGIGIYSRYSRVIEADGTTMSVRSALRAINEVLGEVLSGEEAELDPDTRFALTWFEQYGHNPGMFGDADVLARAKDTSVAGVCDSGIAVSRDGYLRLVEREDLPEDWDPSTDSRLTVWEMTQNLIRALDSSESEAATLLRKVGAGMGDRARQLAYLLYGICEAKGWAAEGGAYNMLVVAWPELERQAMSESEPPTDSGGSGTLFD